MERSGGIDSMTKAIAKYVEPQIRYTVHSEIQINELFDLAGT